MIDRGGQTLPWQVWFEASADTRVDAAVRGVYARLDEQIRQRAPTCWLSGRCCNFETFDHQLYVTGLEIAWVLRQLPVASCDEEAEPGRLPVINTATGDRLSLSAHELAAVKIDLCGPCPLQINKLCSIHTVRPLGCHVFFCQQGTEQWQRELYEHFLAELRHFHEALDIEYCYMEWRAGLREALSMLTAGQAPVVDVQ